MEIGKTFCGRTDGRTHLSSNLLGHRRGDDLIKIRLAYCPTSAQFTHNITGNRFIINTFKKENSTDVY